MEWIQLTDQNGVPIFCNIARANLITPRQPSGSSIVFSDYGPAIHVKETPAEVLACVWGAH